MVASGQLMTEIAVPELPVGDPGTHTARLFFSLGVGFLKR